jgi:hypothetical protein
VLELEIHVHWVLNAITHAMKPRTTASMLLVLHAMMDYFVPNQTLAMEQVYVWVLVIHALVVQSATTNAMKLSVSASMWQDLLVPMVFSALNLIPVMVVAIALEQEIHVLQVVNATATLAMKQEETVSIHLVLHAMMDCSAVHLILAMVKEFALEPEIPVELTHVAFAMKQTESVSTCLLTVHVMMESFAQQ